MDETMRDRLVIRELIEEWAITRDAADWDRFQSVWHDDGYMMATWFQGSASEFIEVSRRGFETGVNILHFLGGSTIDVVGDRAIAQTKMQILQRAEIHGVACDVTCIGRFYDFVERRQGRWAIVLRRLTYEKDWIQPVNPAETVRLDEELLDRFPVGYQHLAYLQTQLGFPVKDDMPGIADERTAELYSQGDSWLNGEPVAAGS